jgi:hypothetical protein
MSRAGVPLNESHRELGDRERLCNRNFVAGEALFRGTQTSVRKQTPAAL